MFSKKGFYEAAVFLCLLCSTLKWSIPFTQLGEVDQHDEPGMYLGQVRDYKDGHRDLRSYSSDWGKLYILWYRILFFLHDDPLKIYDLSGILLCSAIILLSYLVLRRFQIGVGVSSLTALALLTNPHLYLITRRPHHFALVLFLLFALFSFSFSSRKSFLWILSLGFLCTSYARPEYILGHYVLYPFLLVSWLTGEKGKKFRSLIDHLPFVLTGLLMVILLGAPPPEKEKGQNKSLEVFLERNEQRRFIEGKARPDEKEMGAPFYQHYGQKIYRLYGSPENIPAAILSNPQEFFQHLVFNGKSLFRELFHLMGEALLGGLLLLSLLIVLWKGTKPFPSRKRFHLLSLLALFPILVTGLLFSPKPQYLLSALPFLLALAFQRALGPLPLLISPARIYPSVVVLFSLFILFPTDFKAREREHPPVLRNTLVELRETLCSSSPLKIFSDSSYSWHFLKNSEGMNLQDLKNKFPGEFQDFFQGEAPSFFQQLEKLKVNVVILVEKDFFMKGGPIEKIFGEFKAHPEKYGFVALSSTHPIVPSFVKKELMEGKCSFLLSGNHTGPPENPFGQKPLFHPLWPLSF